MPVCRVAHASDVGTRCRVLTCGRRTGSGEEAVGGPAPLVVGPAPAVPGRYAEEGASRSINRVQPTASRCDVNVVRPAWSG